MKERKNEFINERTNTEIENENRILKWQNK